MWEISTPLLDSLSLAVLFFCILSSNYCKEEKKREITWSWETLFFPLSSNVRLSVSSIAFYGRENLVFLRSTSFSVLINHFSFLSLGAPKLRSSGWNPGTGPAVREARGAGQSRLLASDPSPTNGDSARSRSGHLHQRWSGLSSPHGQSK